MMLSRGQNTKFSHPVDGISQQSPRSPFLKSSGLHLMLLKWEFCAPCVKISRRDPDGVIATYLLAQVIGERLISRL